MTDDLAGARATMFSQDGPNEVARTVLDSLPCLVAFLNLAGDVPYANPAFDEIGGREGAIQGIGWALTLHPDDVALAATHRELQLKSENSIPLQVRISDGAGGWLTIAVGYNVVRDDDGALVGWLATAVIVDDILCIDD